MREFLEAIQDNKWTTFFVFLMLVAIGNSFNNKKQLWKQFILNLEKQVHLVSMKLQKLFLMEDNSSPFFVRIFITNKK